MAKHVLSVEIGQQVTKVVEVDYKKKNPHVYKAVTFATPDEVMEDGVIRDKEVLAVAMRNELKEAGISCKDVVFSIASSKIATREVEFPNVKENKIASLVKATAQEYFPIDLNEYTLAHSILEKKKDGKTMSFKVQLLAAPDSLIANYYNFAQEMGWAIESIDYFGNGSLQVLKREIVMTYCVCIQISGSQTMVTFLNEGNQVMQRTVPNGVFHIAENMVLSPESAINDMDSACEALCRDKLVCKTLDYEGLDEMGGGARMTDEQWSRMRDSQSARKVATDAVGEILLSIMRVVDFFRSKNQGVDISSIYITGMGAKVIGIDELFSNELHIPVHRMEHLVNVSFPRHFSEGLYNQTEYIAVVGAAIEPVGFQSKDKALLQSSKDTLRTAQMVFGLAVVLSVAMVGVSLLGYFTVKQKNDDLTARKDSMDYINAIYTENESITGVDDQVQSIYDMTKTYNENLNDLISDLEANLPKNMKVSNLKSDATGVSMTITSKTDISIARMLMNLEGIECLKDLSIPSVAATDDEKGSTAYDFSVTANYVTPATEATEAPAQ